MKQSSLPWLLTSVVNKWLVVRTLFRSLRIEWARGILSETLRKKVRYSHGNKMIWARTDWKIGIGQSSGPSGTQGHSCPAPPAEYGTVKVCWDLFWFNARFSELIWKIYLAIGEEKWCFERSCEGTESLYGKYWTSYRCRYILLPVCVCEDCNK